MNNTKALIIAITLLFSSNSYASIRVIDGDTIELGKEYTPVIVGAMEDGTIPLYKIRLYAIDTPEKRGKCQKEKDLAKKATQFTKNAIKNAKDIDIKIIKNDKYGGRLIGKVYVDSLDLSNLLIKEGLAVPYFGKTKKSWCD